MLLLSVPLPLSPSLFLPTEISILHLLLAYPYLILTPLPLSLPP